MTNWDSNKINSLVQQPLSVREVEILYYLVKGGSAKDIGEKLGISKRTVEHYTENIKLKFKASSKAHVIEKVVDLFILPPL